MLRLGTFFNSLCCLPSLILVSTDIQIDASINGLKLMEYFNECRILLYIIESIYFHNLSEFNVVIIIFCAPWVNLILSS